MVQTYKVMMTDILVIEDNEELGKLISDFLKREGYSVMWEQSAEKGLDLLGKAAFKTEQVLKKEKIFDEIWGVDCFSDVGSLNVHIRWLREKLEEDPRNPRLIRTVWRVGYQFGGSGV